MFRICVICGILLLLIQCGQKKVSPEQDANSQKSIITEWESLRRESDYIQLREKVLNHIHGLRNDGKLPSFHSYYYLAQSYQRGPFNIGLLYCDSALVSYRDDLYLYEKCNALKGALLRKSADYKASIDHMLPLIRTTIDDTVKSEIHWQLSISYRKKGMYDSALYYGQIAERIADQLGNKKYQYYAIQSMANIHSSLGEFEQALQKERELGAIAKDLGKKNLIISNTVNLAVSYFDLDRLDSALVYYEKAQVLANELDDLENLCLLYTIYADYLINKGSYNNAKELMIEALNISKQTGRKDIVLRSYVYLCEAYIGSGDYDDAIKYANIGIDLAKELEMSVELGSFYESLSKIFQQRGDFRKAFINSEKYRIVKDSVLNVSKLQTIKDLDIKYQTEKKSIEIDQLNTQGKLQTLRIEQQNWVIIGVAFLFTIVVLFVILFYRQQRLRKQNELLSLEQRFLRFQMNPHFIFNALGAIQKFTLTNDPIESASFISKFSSLIRQVLEHSRKGYIGIDEEVESLKNYLDVQKLRFEDSFDYTIEVDTGIDQEETKIPPMFAQPFIENALEHGTSALKERGKIIVKFEKSGEDIRLTITDNGKGLEQSTQSKDHISLATTITRERISKIGTLGKRMDLTIENIKNDAGEISGVRVSLLLPTNSAP